jgi:hypothetical protein
VIALGFGIIWVGYAVGMTGYCWVKGYDLSFREIVFPTGFYTGAWPPAKVTDPTVLIPTGSASSSSGGGGGGPAVGSTTAPVAGKCPPGYTKVNNKCIALPIIGPGGTPAGGM